MLLIVITQMAGKMETIITLIVIGYIGFKGFGSWQRWQREKMIHAITLDQKEMEIEKRARMQAKGITFVPTDFSAGVFQMTSFPYASYEDWLTAHRNAAAQSNPALAVQKMDGKDWSIMDLMDEEPSRRAYAHHLNPVLLGEAFGKNFDLRNVAFEDGVKTEEFMDKVKLATANCNEDEVDSIIDKIIEDEQKEAMQNDAMQNLLDAGHSVEDARKMYDAIGAVYDMKKAKGKFNIKG